MTPIHKFLFSENAKLPPKEMREMISAALDFCPDTGVFTWKKLEGRGARTDRVGKPAGAVNNTGYVAIQLGGRKFLAHRMAWLITFGEWPVAEIDHLNGVRTDNRICNLREVCHRVNAENQRLKDGRLGVDFYKSQRKWRARITVRGVCSTLGYFETRSEAQQVYLDAKRKLHEGCTI